MVSKYILSVHFHFEIFTSWVQAGALKILLLCYEIKVIFDSAPEIPAGQSLPGCLILRKFLRLD